MRGVRNAAIGCEVAPNTSATRNAASTLITSAPRPALRCYPAVGIVATNPVTKVPARFAIASRSMSLPASVERALSIHQCLAEQRNLIAINPALGSTHAPTRSCTTVTRIPTVHRALSSPPSTATANTNNEKQFRASRARSAVALHAPNHCPAVATSVSDRATKTNASPSKGKSANNTAPSRGRTAPTNARLTATMGTVHRIYPAGKWSKLLASVVTESRCARVTILIETTGGSPQHS